MKKIVILLYFFFSFLNILSGKEKIKIVKNNSEINYPNFARQVRIQEDFYLIATVSNGEIISLVYSADCNPNSVFREEIAKIKKWKINKDGEYIIIVNFRLKGSEYGYSKSENKVEVVDNDKIYITVKSKGLKIMPNKDGQVKIEITEEIKYPLVAKQARIQEDFYLIVRVWNGKVIGLSYEPESNPNSIFKDEIEKIREWKINTDGVYTFKVSFLLEKPRKKSDTKTTIKIDGYTVFITVKSTKTKVQTKQEIIGIP